MKGLNFKETNETIRRDDMQLKRNSYEKVVLEIKLNRRKSVTDSNVFQLI